MSLASVFPFIFLLPTFLLLCCSFNLTTLVEEQQAGGVFVGYWLTCSTFYCFVCTAQPCVSNANKEEVWLTLSLYE